MIYENEIIMLALGVSVYFFAAINKEYLERIPDWALIWFAYRILLVAWTLTVFEAFFLPETLNILEHFCYACSMVAMAVWCRRTTLTGKKRVK